MADESFDIVISMNGFHAFPDKQKAFQETWRKIYRLLLHKRKIRNYRLACKKYPLKERLVYTSVSDRRTTAEDLTPPV